MHEKDSSFPVASFIPSRTLAVSWPRFRSSTVAGLLWGVASDTPTLQEEPFQLRPIDPEAPLPDPDCRKLAALDQLVTTSAG